VQRRPRGLIGFLFASGLAIKVWVGMTRRRASGRIPGRLAMMKFAKREQRFIFPSTYGDVRKASAPMQEKKPDRMVNVVKYAHRVHG